MRRYLLCLTLPVAAALAACGGSTATQPLPAPGPAPAPTTDMTPTAPRTPTAPPAPPRRNPEYPETRRVDVTDEVHGVKITDPYRWLENGADPEVKAWLDAQDGFARGKLAALPGRDFLTRRLTELYYIDAVGVPYHYGKRYFWSQKHADKEKTIVYWKEGEKGAAQVLLDPNTLSEDGSISLGGWSPSWDGKYVAYRLKKNNSDTATMYVREVATGKDLPKDVIEGARYASASWTHDGKGFYYSWLPTDPSIPVADLPGKLEIRYHVLGTDPATDTIVRAALNDPTSFQGAGVSEDGRWLLLSVGRGWWANDVYFRDLQDKKQKDFTPLVTGQDARYSVSAWKGAFYVVTNEGAPRFRAFKVNPRKPARADWKEIIPEGDAPLDAAYVVGGKLVVMRTRNATSELALHDLDGRFLRTIELPGLGSASGLIGRADEDVAYYSYTSFTQPSQIYKTSVKSGKTDLWYEVKIPADTSNMTAEQVWYTSKDGTRVSMFLVHRKDLVRDGKNPTLLTGYGGFAVGMTPGFSSTYVVWLELGGVIAIPNLRGGDEYGEDWHKAGMLDKKQNVFDDFIAAAEWLVAEKITSPDKLAIAGGSNGGLLVGAAMVQRPELFRAVVCSVPLLDMVRYHLFGSGKTWISEYGSAENAEQFKYLHAYSPYHHIQDGARYPALLMNTADSDDRVDPMHARKFAAAVQWATSSGLPVWVRVEKNAGHGGADLVKKAVESSVDNYSFLAAQLGVSVP
jgi:prolyl oligopeptidase